jgi:GntR family transcriptional regulator/MocR family aminotransferase
VFCDLLRTRLPEWFSFQEPTGGLAVWGTFTSGIDLAQLSAECYRAGLGISDGVRYRLVPEIPEAYLRFGFARQSVDELIQSVDILEKSLRTLCVGKAMAVKVSS